MSIFAGLEQRGGNRGGKNLFNWDDIRGDKYKEYYLGQSMRLQTNWWLDGNLNTTASTEHLKQTGKREEKPKLSTIDQEQLIRVQRKEQQLMMEALGIAPKTRRESGKKLEKFEFKELCKRGVTERDETDISRVAGLGFAPTPSMYSNEVSQLPTGINNTDNNSKNKDSSGNQEDSFLSPIQLHQASLLAKKEEKEKTKHGKEKHKHRKHRDGEKKRHSRRHDSKERDSKSEAKNHKKHKS